MDDGWSASRELSAPPGFFLACIKPKRLLPHPDDEILSGYEEDVLSMHDGY